jgi:hypothetical protein
MSKLAEFNHNHYPSGPKGGQFAPSTGDGPEHIVGVTSARRQAEDPEHYRPNKDVQKEMHKLADDLRGLPGVSRVDVRPALGQWNGGSEFSWAVSYDGNGAARRRLAKVGKDWNQDSVLMVTKSGSTKHDLIWELEFPHVPVSVRNSASADMEAAGLGGWTWFKRNGHTVLRAMSVPAWGGNNLKQLHAQSVIRRVMARQYGLHAITHRRIRGYRAEVFERESRPGVLSYQDVLSGR